MKRIFSILLFSWIAYLFFTTSCANMGMPTGGDKDTIPPVVVHAVPEFNARNYKGHSVSLTFDEFIIADDISTELMVSPPLKKKPVIKTKSKTLTIELDDKLKKNTTYSLDFGDAIVDNNEKNPLKKFRLAFSTGEDFDSLMIGGFVVDAKNIDPVKSAIVMLYHASDSLSAFRDSIPAYVAKTDEKGFYAFTNIPAGKYYLYALEDADNSLTYNQPGERIAFSDSLVAPGTFESKKVSRVDTLAEMIKKIGEPGVDSVAIAKLLALKKIKADSIAAKEQAEHVFSDTLQLGKHTERVTVKPHVLLMFQEETNDQYLNNYTRQQANLIRFYFENAVTDSFNTRLISPVPSPEWSVLEFNPGRDTISMWINDTVISKIDTLKMELKYQALDSLKKTMIKTDTLEFVYSVPRVKEKRRRKKEGPVIIQPFSFRQNIRDSFDPYNPVILEAPEPLESFDYSKIHLYHLKDTVEQPIAFDISQDSLIFRRYQISYPWTFEEQYRLEIDSAAAKTYSGFPSGRISQKFTVQKENYYGKIFLNISNIPGPCIVQLLKNTEKEEVLHSAPIKADGEIEFPFLKPDKYKIRLIVDRNSNGKWDTGDLGKGRQPERVVYFQKILRIRSNFEIRESWTLPDDLQFKKTLIDDNKDKSNIKKKRSRSL